MVTIEDLDITIIDNQKAKKVFANVSQLPPYSLLLWEGETYDSMADYTQEQVESKTLELINSAPEDIRKRFFGK